jgi:hypothetical protein
VRIHDCLMSEIFVHTVTYIRVRNEIIADLTKDSTLLKLIYLLTDPPRSRKSMISGYLLSHY